MMMILVKKLKSVKLACTSLLVCFFSLIMLSAPISAHVLDETTAQVILRDGQVEIKVYTDLEHLLSALQSNEAWLLGDIDAVMPGNLNVSQQEAFAVNALKQSLHLKVNGKALSFDNAIIETATLESDSHKDSHAHSREMVFRAKHSFSQVSELSISFPKILAAVHTSFVKPQYKLLSAGETAEVIF